MGHLAAAAATSARIRSEIGFDRTQYLPQLFGEYDKNLICIENKLGVTISARGNRVTVEGPQAQVDITDALLRDLYRKAESGWEINEALISTQLAANDEPALRHALGDDEAEGNAVPIISIKTRKKTIVPRNTAQAHYMMALARDEIVFGIGPAGTGKTYIAVAQAVNMLMTGQVQRLILSRPAVEAGERLGFLPGDMKEKVDPYLRPLYDALNDCMPPEQVEKRIASGEIEIAPIAFMRGRTLADAFIILDEAQNTTPEQMKMFLTRFGQNSRMVVCGDPRQCDLPGIPARGGQPAQPPRSGLNDAMDRLEGVEGITFSRFEAKDVVRHSIVGRIVEAYEG